MDGQPSVKVAQLIDQPEQARRFFDQVDVALVDQAPYPCVGKGVRVEHGDPMTAAKQLLLDSVGCRVVTAAGPTGKNQRIHNSLIVHLSLDSWLRCIRRKTPAGIRRNPRRTERLTLEKHSATKEHR